MAEGSSSRSNWKREGDFRLDIQGYFNDGGVRYVNLQIQTGGDTYSHIEVPVGVELGSTGHIQDAFEMSMKSGSIVRILID